MIGLMNNMKIKNYYLVIIKYQQVMNVLKEKLNLKVIINIIYTLLILILVLRYRMLH